MSLLLSGAMLFVPVVLLSQSHHSRAKTQRVDAADEAALAARAFRSRAGRSASFPRAVVESVDDSPTVVRIPSDAFDDTSDTTDTTEGAATTEPPTTVKPAARSTVTARRPASTTTTAPRPRPTTTTTTAPPPPKNTQSGPASWYDAPAGTCAHKTAPLGTVITVTNLDNGQTTQCKVADRGPYSGSRIIDLAKTTFAQIADPAAGVINVRISW